MLIEERSRVLHKVWPQWHIKQKIGEGSYGEVFRIEREDFGRTFESALKIISIPKDQAELDNVRSDLMNEAEVEEYFRSVTDEIINEFVIMERLKGHSNIVNYEDHAMVPHESGPGWDILIRMELLTPLPEYLMKHPFQEKDVIALGIDICEGLEFCHGVGVIHRDIKPANIMRSDFGKYKIADFGIARKMARSVSAMSQKGTFSFMAPEVFRGHRYDETVDLYSLGIMMYRLMNRNREPFIPIDAEKISYGMKQEAMERRMRGERMPAPVDASDRLSAVILKACAFRPQDRFHSAALMKKALQKIDSDSSDIQTIRPEPREPVGTTVYEEPSVGMDSGRSSARPYETTDRSLRTGPPPEQEVNYLLLAVLGILIVLAITMAILLITTFSSGNGTKKGSFKTEEISTAQAASTTQPPEKDTTALTAEETAKDVNATYVTAKSIDIDFVELFAHPGDAARARTIQEARVVHVTKECSAGGEDWCYIDYFGKTGWVKKDDLRWIADEDLSFHMTNHAKKDIVFINGLSGKPLCLEPKKFSEKTNYKVPYGTEYRVLEIKNGFARVKESGKDLWVDMDHAGFYNVTGYWQVEVCNGNSTGIHLREGSSGKTESLVDEIRVGTVLKIDKYQNGWGRTDYQGITGWVELHRMTPCPKTGIESEDIW